MEFGGMKRFFGRSGVSSLRFSLFLIGILVLVVLRLTQIFGDHSRSPQRADRADSYAQYATGQSIKDGASGIVVPLLTKAHAFRYEKQYDLALAELDTALQMDSTCAPAYFTCGDILLWDIKDHSKAITEFDRAIHFKPAYHKAFVFRGDAFMATGDTAKAMADFNYAVELSPEQEDAYNARGMLFSKQGNLAGAVADYTRCIELLPTDAHNYGNRAYIYLLMGDTLKAKEDLKAGVKLGDKAFGDRLKKLEK
jgi:tetratricopeptide (TPR) repeat protein